MKTNNNTYDLLLLFDDFIRYNRLNKRTLSGGRNLTAASKNNYIYVRNLLADFSKSTGFELRIKDLSRNKRTFNQEKRYYERFYLKFTDYLFNECNHYDNYVGNTIKLLKSFFNWVVNKKGINAGGFYKDFYRWKEDIQIVALSPEQLNFLIFNENFEEQLNPKMKFVKDFFVFGCTTGLRISDLRSISENDIEYIGRKCYLRKVSKKTQTFTRIKLPEYAVNIVERSEFKKGRLFNELSLHNFNKHLKNLIELAGWDYAHPKIRHKRGKAVEVFKDDKQTSYRFCDLISSHTMRRTAITTMLNLGMSHIDVRRISGHAPNSAEFFRYVKFSQETLDLESDKVFQKLSKKRMKRR